jgi:hypothetical protein
MFDPMEAFMPGLAHLRAEQERRRHEAQLVCDAAPPRDIDLEGGTAVVRLPAQAPDQPDAAPREAI